VHLHLEGKGPHMDPAYSKSFRAINLFTGANARGAVHEGRADFVPIFLSDV
jgi:4-hydroxybutyrate CoA-transferase